MSDDLAERLARNVRELRQARGFTQQQMAKLAGLPRATWSNLESGSGNPTLTVLHAVCTAFQVSLEEIVAEARANARLYHFRDRSMLGSCSGGAWPSWAALPSGWKDEPCDVQEFTESGNADRCGVWLMGRRVLARAGCGRVRRKH